MKGTRNRIAGDGVGVFNHGFHGLHGLGGADNPCNRCNPWFDKVGQTKIDTARWEEGEFDGR